MKANKQRPEMKPEHKEIKLPKRGGVKMNNKEKVDEIKHNVNEPKSRLIRILSKLEEINPKEAEKLSKIIMKLEAWQNS